MQAPQPSTEKQWCAKPIHTDRSSIHLSRSLLPFIHPCIYSFSIQSVIHFSIPPFTHPSLFIVDPSLRPSATSIYPYTHASIHPFIHHSLFLNPPLRCSTSSLPQTKRHFRYSARDVGAFVRLHIQWAPTALTRLQVQTQTTHNTQPPHVIKTYTPYHSIIIVIINIVTAFSAPLHDPPTSSSHHPLTVLISPPPFNQLPPLSPTDSGGGCDE